MANLKLQNYSFSSTSPVESFHWSTKLNFFNLPFSSSGYYFLFFLFYPFNPLQTNKQQLKTFPPFFLSFFCLFCIQAWALLSLMIISVFILSYRRNEVCFSRWHCMWLPYSAPSLCTLLLSLLWWFHFTSSVSGLEVFPEIPLEIFTQAIRLPRWLRLVS